MVLSDIFLQLDRLWQCAVYTLLHLACLMLHLHLWPFTLLLLNRVAVGVHLVLLVVTQLLVADGSPPPLTVESPTLIIASVLVLAASAALVGLVVALRWGRAKQPSPPPPTVHAARL
jgi:hypothetical protein